ncbi:Hypothetical predicted protein [Mytilus galloprovincialis]|uniref:Uncharacterized protein n=1 Tax=Mytilus galloprovincialis TaxID=29158 RepID=A0A8B6CBV7_MYTGA|nr:Hypothetical predicted protein [Mytilus galloprovincialis]
MPVVKCPVPDCQYETDDLDAVMVSALLKTHATVHSAAAGAIVSVKVETVKRQTVRQLVPVKIGHTLSLDGKTTYKQLRSADGSMVDKSEQEVIATMRTLAVREENTMVARVSLHGMTQNRDETVRSFRARLRSQACVCKFTLQCTGCEQNVDYTEAILRDVLTRWLRDPDIQLDLLGDKKSGYDAGTSLQIR